MNLYVFSRAVLIFYFKVVCGFKVTGTENVPKQGGFILAANHVSYLDPPVVGSACPRKIFFMAKVELFHVPFLAQWLRGVGVIPLKRNAGDLGAMRKAAELLKQGECVCVFPEGMRVPPGGKKEAGPGIAFLARMARVPVVPAAILGTQPWRRKIFGLVPWFSPLEVRFGKPLEFDFQEKATAEKRDAMQKIADAILQKIRELKYGD